MIGFFRRLWGALTGYVDLAGRLDDVEDELERIRGRMREHELEWTNEVDKLTKLYQRQTARLRSATESLEASQPALTDVRAARAARKAAILARRGVNGSNTGS